MSLSSLRVVELRERLRGAGLSTAGRKAELVERLSSVRSGKAEAVEPEPEPPRPTVVELRKMTVGQLKAMLREKGLPLGGHKAELVERVFRAPARKAEGAAEGEPAAKRRKKKKASGPPSREADLKAMLKEELVGTAAKSVGVNVPKGALKSVVVRELVARLPPYPVPLAPTEAAPGQSRWATHLPVGGGLDLVAKILDPEATRAAMLVCRQWALWVRAAPLWRRAVRTVLGAPAADVAFPALGGETAPEPSSPDYPYRLLRNVAAMPFMNARTQIAREGVCRHCLQRPLASLRGSECAACLPACSARRRLQLRAGLQARGKELRADSSLASSWIQGCDRMMSLDRVVSILVGVSDLFAYGHIAYSQCHDRLRLRAYARYYKGAGDGSWMAAMRAAFATLDPEQYAYDSDDYYGGGRGSECLRCGDYCPDRYCGMCGRSW